MSLKVGNVEAFTYCNMGNNNSHMCLTISNNPYKVNLWNMTTGKLVKALELSDFSGKTNVIMKKIKIAGQEMRLAFIVSEHCHKIWNVYKGQLIVTAPGMNPCTLLQLDIGNIEEKLLNREQSFLIYMKSNNGYLLYQYKLMPRQVLPKVQFVLDVQRVIIPSRSKVITFVENVGNTNIAALIMPDGFLSDHDSYSKAVVSFCEIQSHPNPYVRNPLKDLFRFFFNS